MTKQEVSERFLCGPVQHEVCTHKSVQWLGRMLGILFCVGLIKWAPSDVGNRMLCYLLVLCILWWMNGLGEVLVYICERGFVIKQRPGTVRDYFHSLICHDEYYLYIPYDSVVGFTEDWKELQAINANGGIFVVPLDLQLASYKDKLQLQQAINNYKNQS